MSRFSPKSIRSAFWIYINFSFSDWAFLARKAVSAIRPRMVSTDADYCAVAEAIRPEYGTSKRNANVNSSGVAMSNARCAITNEKNTFAIKRNETDCNAKSNNENYSFKRYGTFSCCRLIQVIHVVSVSLAIRHTISWYLININFFYNFIVSWWCYRRYKCAWLK